MRCAYPGVIPEETARIARAAFPKGNVYMKMREALGQLYFDSEPLSLFRCDCGQPAYSPGKLSCSKLESDKPQGSLNSNINNELESKAFFLKPV
ncbi:MAG: hypothetical protein V7L23_00300 [Nostoc sp.]|uniref:hypothetical protein n=1 Tax=Nostoc sp. TaxID=1180 RepID=UPI002FEF7453